MCKSGQRWHSFYFLEDGRRDIRLGLNGKKGHSTVVAAGEWLKDHSAWNLPNTIWPDESLECEQRYLFDLNFFGGTSAMFWGDVTSVWCSLFNF